MRETIHKTTAQIETSLGLLRAEGEKAEPTEEEIEVKFSGQAFNREQVHNTCKEDLNLLAGIALPDIFEFMFPPMYLAIWSWLQTYVHRVRDFSKLALGMPRGFAKTTLVKLFILYCILFTHRKFILIVSSTESHGVNIVGDVMSMLKEPNIVKIFGDYELGKERDKLNLQIFSFRGRRIVLGAIGAEGSIRGLNIGFDRPDVMIFEDFQEKEESESELLSKKLLERMVGTIMKAKSPKGCLYLYIANMYPTVGSILRKLKENQFWTKFIVGGILSDGSSLWEELQPIEQLLQEFQNDLAMGSPEIFFAEVLNDETAGLRAGIDLGLIPLCPYQPKIDLPQGRFIVIDPAGEKHTSDLNAAGYFEVYDGKPVFKAVVQGHWSPLELIRQSLILAIENRCALIVVEGVAYQDSLLFWFNHICQAHDLEGFYFEAINPEAKSKNSRIKTMLRSLVQTTNEDNKLGVEAQIFLAPEVRGLVLNQIMAWNPMTTTNVDELLDLLAYSQQVLRMYEELAATEFNVEMLVVSQAKVLPAYATSPI